MSLTYETTINAGVGIAGAVSRGENEIVTLLTNNKVRRYNLTSGSQLGSDITLGGTFNQIALVNSASAICFSFFVQSFAVVDLVNEAVSILTGLDYCQNTFSGQAAGNPSTGYAVGCAYTQQILKFNGNTFQASTNVVDFMSSDDHGTCMHALTNGNFLIGTLKGAVFEFDPVTLKAVKGLQLTVPGVTFIALNSTQPVTSLAQVNNFVLAGTDAGLVYQIHWPTLKVVDTTSLGWNDSTHSVIISNGASGEVLMANGENSGQTFTIVAEKNILSGLHDCKELFFLDSTSPNVVAGITGNKAWIVSSNNKIYVTIIVPDLLVNTTAAIVDNGDYQEGRLIRIVDDGDAYVFTDTPLGANPETVPVLAGVDVIDLAVYGTGVDEKGQVSGYST